MKYLLISLLFFIYGCSKDTPTASTEPELDTTIKSTMGNWTIKRWDVPLQDWIDTVDNLAVSTSWRFISYTSDSLKRVRIKGGYTFTISNPTNYDVEFVFGRFVFEDRGGIPIYSHEFSKIKRNVRANGTNTFEDTFEIQLDDIDTANEITKMVVWASVART